MSTNILKQILKIKNNKFLWNVNKYEIKEKLLLLARICQQLYMGIELIIVNLFYKVIHDREV